MLSRHHYYYLPISIFIFIWFLTYLLYFFSPLKFYDVQSQTHFTILFSLLLVIVGYLYIRLFSFSEDIAIYSVSKIKRKISLNYNYLLLIILLLNIIIIVSAAIFLYSLAQERGGILEYFINPIRARQLIVETTVQSGWTILLGVTSYGMNLIVMSSILSGILFCSKYTYHKTFSFVSIILTIFISIVNFSRYSLITPTLMWLFSAFFISYYFEHHRRKSLFKQLMIVLIIFVLIFSLFSYVIISLRHFTDEENIGKTYILQANYYLAGNIVGLDRYFMRDDPFLWGRGIFRTIYKWIVRIGVSDEHDVLGYNYEFVKIASQYGTNTYSYIRTLYEDYGVIGLFILSFFWGIFSGMLAKSFITKFSLLKLYFIIIISLAFSLSFFGFYFVNITRVIYEILIFSMADLYFRKKRVYHF